MGEAVSNSKFSIFDFIVYLIPGLFFILFLSFIIPGMPYIDAVPEYFVAVILAFPIGNIFHEFAFIPAKFLWIVYSIFKERDSEGHGVENPKYLWGKFAKFLRYRVLEPQKSKKLSTTANNLAVKEFSLEEKDYFSIFYFKEFSFINNPEARKGFEYLQYQSLFCKSMSFCLFLISVLTASISIFSDFAIYRNNLKILDFEGFGVVTAISCLFLCVLFVKRYKFFEIFRKQIIDANLVNIFFKPNK